MTLLAPSFPMVCGSESSARNSMSVCAPTPKVSSDDRPFFMYGGGNPMFRQTDPREEILKKVAFQLVLDYVKAISKIECENHDLSNKVFAKIIEVLINAGIRTDKIVVENTGDESLLVRGLIGNLSYYFEVYFDTVEYSIGYEVICNLFKNKNILASASGSIDFVINKLAEKTNPVYSTGMLHYGLS